MTINEIGYRAGLLAFAATVAYDLAQIAQLAGLLASPFDEILIYATSLCITAPFLIEFLALHHLTSKKSAQFWTHAALLFAVIYVVFVTANYVVQLATVIPAKMGSRDAAFLILEQTPHSMFWNFDAIGYISMGLASLCAALSLNKVDHEKWARMALLANALMTPLISIVYFYPTYSPTLLALGSPWGITAPLSMLLLASVVRNKPAGEQ